MSDISKLYEEAMTNSEVKKTASVDFDKEFFEKVASGDAAASSGLNDFVESARADGYDDDAIEIAIGNAMSEAGYGTDNVDFETQKVASYEQGSHKAIDDVLEKAAELGVSEEDIMDFYLGASFGEGYTDTRRDLDEVVEKIAAGAVKKKMQAGYEGLKRAGKSYADAMRGKGRSSNIHALSKDFGESTIYDGARAARSASRRTVAARGGTALAATAATAGAARAVNNKRRKK